MKTTLVFFAGAVIGGVLGALWMANGTPANSGRAAQAGKAAEPERVWPRGPEQAPSHHETAPSSP